ncbi:hypothetical protein GCM10025869_32210 [Homoserinibacter gongjuensis]|uniref:SDR family NAD(P)-dependent oxidoreductase n=1 Tax=Homoserinibacter gongjuensis TaxID=1162968 RepID=A0ABQ6JYF5_9MICO|nr:hypothetical protein GCM10025869_32210 [Homoserinibacter gongjuensis]
MPERVPAIARVGDRERRASPDSLRGVRALITGSSRGIGADTAGYLADAGARVVINYRNKEARALKVVAGIEERGERPSRSAPT